MKIVEFRNCANMVVEFQDNHKYRVPATYGNFKNGCITNPYDRTLYGVGYVGVGKYNNPTSKSGNERSYNTWMAMHERCYTKYDKLSNYTYYDCEVCSDWQNYQTFTEWYHNNYYEVGEGRIHLDKDIIKPGNTIYCPEYCMFIPQRINMLFLNKPNKRGLPNGIRYDGKKYHAKYNHVDIGAYNTLIEAYNEYAKAKERKIKLVAEEYKNIIPHNVYSVLINYKCLIENDKNYMAS